MIELTKDERRIITKLRELSKDVRFGTIEVEFNVHDGQVKMGKTAKIAVRI